MSRTQPTQMLLEFVGPAVVRWEALPAPVRDRVRAMLAALLRQAAGRAPRPEAGDDE
jgi:hypothetical protein